MYFGPRLAPVFGQGGVKIISKERESYALVKTEQMEMLGHKLVRVKTDKALQDGIQEDVQVAVGKCVEYTQSGIGIAKAVWNGARKGLSSSFNTNTARIAELEALVAELKAK